MRDNQYDLAILDWMLPDGSGLDLCKIMRDEEFTQPICMLTAKTQVEDLVAGLDSGADDYITKPFDMKVLIARVRSLLRRRENTYTPSVLSSFDLTLDTGSGKVTRNGKDILLRPKEFGLLEYLLRHKGIAVTRDELLEHVWDELSDAFSNTVDVHISYLRTKIDAGFPKPLIQTVKGKGYMICED